MSLEEIGAILGFLAFAGLAVLTFLTFQQARHVRRLREWAGRAPERAAATELRVEDVPAGAGERPREEPEDTGPGRLEVARERFAERWAEVDRRMPVDPRLLLGGLLAIVLGVGIATSGFGLLGDDEPASRASGAGKQASGSGDGGDRTTEKPKPPRVAVLNGTAAPGGVGVPGIAERVSEDVDAAGFRVGAVENAGSFPASVVMYKGDAQSDAEKLASEISTLLGETAVVEMTPEVEEIAGGSEIALVVGQDDAGI